MARQYHLPLNEFDDNLHFPWQLYVCEARRLKGRYIFTENDVKVQDNAERTRIFHDSTISGEFPIDSFPVSREPSLDREFSKPVLRGEACLALYYIFFINHINKYYFPEN